MYTNLKLSFNIPTYVGYIHGNDDSNEDKESENEREYPTREEVIQSGIYCPGYDDDVVLSQRNISLTELKQEKIFRKVLN